MEQYPLVYRCALAIKPQQPFLDWLNEIDPVDNPTLQELRQDSSLYLIPDYEDADDIDNAIQKYLRLNYTGIFINELSEWYVDPKMYPPFSYETFLKWFEISTHTMIYDTVNKPIQKE